MKNRYSHPVYELKRIAKINKHLKINQIAKIALTEAKNENDIAKMCLYIMEYEMLNGSCQHIFITDNTLLDFFMNTDLKLTMSLDSLMCYYPFEKIKWEEGNQNGENFNIIINHKKNDISYKFSCNLNKYTGVFQIVCSPGVDGTGYSVHGQCKNDNEIKLDDINKVDQKVFNLLFNLIYYANVFPDKIVPGVPKDFESFETYKGIKTISINPHESIIYRSGVTPHFRKGHFRNLESDRYVNKKGQIIWVSESFVKGFQAKTVIE